MSSMNEAEIDDLLGAYALDALPVEEARRVEQHLRTCADHRAAAAELRGTASRLSLAVDEMEPSPDLRHRIVEAVRATPNEPTAQPHSNSAERVIPLPRPRRRPAWMPAPSRLAIAAAVVLGLGISALLGYRFGQSGQQQVAYTFNGDAATAPGAEARLVYFKDRHQTVVAANGLPRLGSGQVYEMWFIKNGVPVDEGITASAAGNIGAQLSGDLLQYQQFAITIEPGEQPIPTTKPVLIGNLQAG